MSDELENFSMLELFRLEVENQVATLSDGLMALETSGDPGPLLESLMRAAHSLKGAARMVDIQLAVTLAHAMEDCFVAAQSGELTLHDHHIDLLLRGVDQLVALASNTSEPAAVQELVSQIQCMDAIVPDAASGAADTGSDLEDNPPDQEIHTRSQPEATPSSEGIRADSPPAESAESTVRVSSTSLNRLVGLAGEVRVESRWLRPFAEAVLHVKHRQAEIIGLLDRLSDHLYAHNGDEYSKTLVSEIHTKTNHCRHEFSDRLSELDDYDRRVHGLANRLHNEVLTSRMRPFADVTRGFPRMIRDVARELGKKVDLKIEGLSTQVDRDILELIEAPLSHLLRNALDHGIESPEQRCQAGKSGQATIRLKAVHSSGMLSIHVEDDGRGIDVEKLRSSIIRKNLVDENMASELSEAELLEFLFLPGFSTRENVTEISGRGVGLDVVHSTVQRMRGLARVTTSAGKGTRFHLQLPLTLSVIRALLIEISGEPYAIPLARIDRTLKLDADQVEALEGRQYFTLGNQHIGIVFASQVLGHATHVDTGDYLPIVILGERTNRSGLVVDRFIGERDLVVHPLDKRLGKTQDISAASILENGDPCLIVDVDDMLRSIDLLISGGRLNRVRDTQTEYINTGKRILVVDDSITVREVERNMLAARGYHVDVAVDGMDGWNAVRMNDYDLVISDVDMPRMNGFEFVRQIKEDARLGSIPVMIVSYKDREEDRQRGLDAGADYYLTKGSFHDETLIQAVADLIGEAE
ncbi:MAG: hybrid sensor histidine kinase/response regulator [Thiogranum sp.]|nr:hybrid sensor histidine kinase/response regulator [Thiogranum sp.]